MDWVAGSFRKNEIKVMAEQKLWYLVSYDVRNPKRLQKTAKHLKGYGRRLQYSVFRCKLSLRQLERLQWELSKILEKDDDILILGLCKNCGSRIRKKGGLENWSEGDRAFEII